MRVSGKAPRAVGGSFFFCCLVGFATISLNGPVFPPERCGACAILVYPSRIRDRHGQSWVLFFRIPPSVLSGVQSSWMFPFSRMICFRNIQFCRLWVAHEIESLAWRISAILGSFLGRQCKRKAAAIPIGQFPQQGVRIVSFPHDARELRSLIKFAGWGACNLTMIRRYRAQCIRD